MSNLKTETTTTRSNGIYPSSVVCFEDALESNSFSIYELLQLSSLREKEDLEDHKEYHSQIVKLMKSNLKPVEDASQLTFAWTVDDEEYHSTSLLFELYFTTLSLAHKLFDSKENYKSAVHLFKQCRDILPLWKTADLVYPNCPYVCTKEYLKNMLYLTNGSMLLKMESKGKQEAVRLSSAMKCTGNVAYHIPTFSDIALNHYLVARALLFHHLALKDLDNIEQGEKANQSYTCANEALELCRLVDRSKCHMDTALNNRLNTLLNDTTDHIYSLQQVYYAVPAPLESITLPASISNDNIEAR